MDYWLRLSIRFDVPVDCSAELSPSGYTFFTDLFEAFDKVGPSYFGYSMGPFSYFRTLHFRTWMVHLIMRN
jgi:hypothetical protein